MPSSSRSITGSPIVGAVFATVPRPAKLASAGAIGALVADLCLQFFGHVQPQGAGGAMKRKRFTEEQIAFALRQAEAGTPLEEACRKMGDSELASTGGRSGSPGW